MTSFAASVFNAETDTDRPVIDTTFEYLDNKYTVKKVDHLLISDVIAGRVNDPDKEEFDTVAVRPHAYRPAVLWVIWGNLNNT